MNKLEAQIEIWKQIVSVQMHFNELEMKIRNLSVSILGMALAGAAISYKEDITLTIYKHQLPAASAILIAAFFIWHIFYLIDRHWYHRLLYGAVKAGSEVEGTLKSFGIVAPLTQEISKQSPVIFFGKKLDSKAKIDIVYGSVATILLSGSFFMIYVPLGWTVVALGSLKLLSLYICLKKHPS